jgi:hypothetical protein
MMNKKHGGRNRNHRFARVAGKAGKKAVFSGWVVQIIPLNRRRRGKYQYLIFN